MALRHSTSLYFNLHYTTMVQLYSTLLYITLPLLYFTLLSSTLSLPWLNFILLFSTLLYHGSRYFAVIVCTVLYLGSTSLYVNLHYSTIALLDSTWFYIAPPWIYFTLLDSTLLYHSSTSFYFTLHYCAMALFLSPLLYISWSMVE